MVGDNFSIKIYDILSMIKEGALVFLICIDFSLFVVLFLNIFIIPTKYEEELNNKWHRMSYDYIEIAWYVLTESLIKH